MKRTVYFSCGCSAVVDSYYTVPVREVSLVCPVHVEREAEDGRPETLAFFADVDEVSDLEHLKLTLCAQYKWAFREDSRGNDPVRTAARRIHNKILEATSEAEIEAAIREA